MQQAENSVEATVKLLRQPDVAKLCCAYLITYTAVAMAPVGRALGVLDLTGSTKDADRGIAAPTLAAAAVLVIGAG